MKSITVDNFEQLSVFLPEEQIGNEFYHVQILRRKKENPDVGCNSVLINSYYIRDKKHLERVREEIILLCKHYNARAYINLNVRDKEKLVILMIKKLLSHLENKEFSTIQNTFSSVSDSSSMAKDKKWIIDLDGNECNDIEYIIKLIKLLKGNILSTVPTINGIHLITTPFNSSEFKKYYASIDIKKNNATLLYYDN